MPPASAEPLLDELNWNGESQLKSTVCFSNAELSIYVVAL